VRRANNSRRVAIQNLNRPQAGTIQAAYCASFFCRLRGLTFRRSLPTGEGLLLVQERESRMDAAIHMFFVWIDLAVVWIDAAKRVVDIKLARRWRPFYMPQGPARYVLELNPEHLNDFEIGDLLSIEPLPVP
jgi:uncharacterized membrane protein (UPF0127 family)